MKILSLLAFVAILCGTWAQKQSDNSESIGDAHNSGTGVTTTTVESSSFDSINNLSSTKKSSGTPVTSMPNPKITQIATGIITSTSTSGILASPAPKFNPELSTSTKLCLAGSTVVRNCQEGCSAILTTVGGSVSSTTICYTTSCSQFTGCDVGPPTWYNRWTPPPTSCAMPSPTSANLMGYYQWAGFSNAGWGFNSMLPDDEFEDDGGDIENPNDCDEIEDRFGEPGDLTVSQYYTSPPTTSTSMPDTSMPDPTPEPSPIVEDPAPVLPPGFEPPPVVVPPLGLPRIPVPVWIPIDVGGGKTIWVSSSSSIGGGHTMTTETGGLDAPTGRMKH